MESLSVSEAGRRLPEPIGQAASGERILIGPSGRPAAALIGAGELGHLERAAGTARRLALVLGQERATLDRVGAGLVRPAVAAFGLWRDQDDVERLADEVTRERQARSGRSPAAP